MENEPPHVLLIEDNPGDADLVRLRLVESNSDVHVNCVPRLADALACLDVETPSTGIARSESSRQSWRGYVSPHHAEGSKRAGCHPVRAGR